MTQPITRRRTSLKLARVKLRAGGEGEHPKAIEGYAAVYYREGEPETEYQIWSDFIERLMPGCFDSALERGDDARALFDHESSKLLGRVSSGTCELRADDVGLWFSVPYDPDDPDHVTVAAKIRRGDLSGCSFAMGAISADWSEQPMESDPDRIVSIRNITDIGQLWDVGPVTYPAYEATEVGVRTAVENQAELLEARSILKAHRQALEEHEASIAASVEMDWTMANIDQPIE